MKEIKGEQWITYRWWREKGEVKLSHHEALRESALERAHEQCAQGFTSGELSDYVRMGAEDGEDGVHYKGWWELHEASPEDPARYLPSGNGLPTCEKCADIPVTGITYVQADELKGNLYRVWCGRTFTDHAGIVAARASACGKPNVELHHLRPHPPSSILGKTATAGVADEVPGEWRHRSGPNGCDPDCRVCAAEREYAARHLGKPADKASATALELIKAGCSPEHLDEAVQQAASELASAANNDGLEAQVKFLLAAGDWKPEDILFKAKEAKEEG